MIGHRTPDPDADRTEAVVAILVAACVCGLIVVSAVCWRLWQ